MTTKKKATTRKKRAAPLTAGRLKEDFGKVLDLEMTLTKRAAHCLDFCARMYPKQYIPWNWMLQAVQGFKRTPRIDNDAVMNLRHRSSGIRQVCIVTYKRTTDLHPGLGVRALVDDEDVVKYAFVKSMRRFDSAKNAMLQTASLVDVRKLPNTDEFKELKQWYVNDATKILSEVSASTFGKRLLSPTAKKKLKKKKRGK